MYLNFLFYMYDLRYAIFFWSLKHESEAKKAHKCAHVVLQDDTVLSETVDKASARAKLKLTIPREPELKTAHRAERMRLACLCCTFCSGFTTQSSLAVW